MRTWLGGWTFPRRRRARSPCWPTASPATNPPFADLARKHLQQSLGGVELGRSVEDAVDQFMAGFAELECPPTWSTGVEALSEAGIRQRSW